MVGRSHVRTFISPLRLRNGGTHRRSIRAHYRQQRSEDFQIVTRSNASGQFDLRIPRNLSCRWC